MLNGSVILENNGTNKFERVIFNGDNNDNINIYNCCISEFINSIMNIKRINIYYGITSFNETLLSIHDHIMINHNASVKFTDSNLTSGYINIVSDNNNSLNVSNLKNTPLVNTNVTSNTSFSINFKNLRLDTPSNNPFVFEIHNGYAKINESIIKDLNVFSDSRIYLVHSNLENLTLRDISALLSQGSRVNKFHLEEGNDIKYIGPMQWHDNITADSDINRFMVGRLHFIYTRDNQHAVRCGLAVITDSSGNKHKCVMTPDNYGWLFVDESYTGLSSGDVLLNYTYKVKTLGDGIHKQDGSGIYKTTDECRYDLESFGAINSSTPNCTVLTPDIHGDIGNITDPCPFETKPDGSYHYKCYYQINDWAKNWNFDGTGGWFSKYGLPVPSHYYLEES